MKTAIVTDSTAYLSPQAEKEEHLSIISVPVIVDEKIYYEGRDVFADEYYQLLKESRDFPKTSQPAIGEVLDLFLDLKKQGYQEVIVITMSSGISGFSNNLKVMIDETTDLKITVFDSMITSVPMGTMVEKALELANQGKSTDEILPILKEIRENMKAFMIVDDLDHLVRGGRLNNGAAIIGGLLKIKPVLTFEEGKIVVAEKIRTSRKAFNRVEDLLLEYFPGHEDYRFFIIHANAKEEAEAEKVRLLEKNPQMQIDIAYFGPVIGTHVGEKALGFGWVKK